MQTIGKPIKLAVVGTRTFTDKKRLYFELDEFRKIRKVTEIVSGIDKEDEKTKGADSFARDYAKEKGIPYKGFSADWKDMSPPVLKKTGLYGDYNALAGPNRNTKIADYADEGLAFWDYESTGTHDTIKKFNDRKKKIKIVKIHKP
jgi:hypothetical protein